MPQTPITVTIVVPKPTVSVGPGHVAVVDVAKQGVQGPPGNATGVIGETPSGAVNGSNSTFTTLYPFIPESVQVFINGLLLLKPDDFNTSGNSTIQLTFSPAVGEQLQVQYTRLT